MNIKIKNLSQSRTELEIELPETQWQEFLDQAAADLSKDLRIEGFRPGKAPRYLVEQKLGSQKLLESAADLAIKKVYVQIILDKKIEVIGRPKIQITKIGLNSFVFKAEVAVLPVVELADYQKITKDIKRKNKNELEPTEKEIEDSLEYIRKSRAEANYKRDETDSGQQETGAEQVDLPELNDEFARSLGDFANLDALKASIKEGLSMEKQEKEKQRWRLEALRKIIEQSSMDVPEILIESEMNKMIEELKAHISQMGSKFETYLEEIKKTEDDLKKESRQSAEERVKIALVLKSIAEKEKVEVSEQEAEEEVNRFLKRYADTKAAKTDIDIDYLQEYTKGVLKNEKVFQLLESYNK